MKTWSVRQKISVQFTTTPFWFGWAMSGTFGHPWSSLAILRLLQSLTFIGIVSDAFDEIEQRYIKLSKNTWKHAVAPVELGNESQDRTRFWTKSDRNSRSWKFLWESAYFFLAGPWEIIFNFSFSIRNKRLIEKYSHSRLKKWDSHSNFSRKNTYNLEQI